MTLIVFHFWKMELDIGDLLSNFLLEYCEFYNEEEECTIDSFLLAALDSYECQYATAPAQPIEQPHPQSTFTSPTPNFTFRLSLLPCQTKMLWKHEWKVSPTWYDHGLHHKKFKTRFRNRCRTRLDQYGKDGNHIIFTRATPNWNLKLCAET